MQKQLFHHKLLYFSNILSGIALLAVITTACHHNGPDTPDKPIVNASASGIYILNEGLYQMNNSTLSYYDYTTGTFTEDFFLQNNHRGLGDTGNDLQKYGSKLYAVINGSNTIEIMKLSDATSLKSISLTGKQPRNIAFYAGKAYVTCFNGNIIRIDTATFNIDGTLKVGENPDGLCVSGHKLYVANSGGLNAPNYGHTVSVIDLNTFIIIKNIEVVSNPTVLMSDDYGDVYLVSRGNYGTIPYTFQRIDTQQDKVVQTFDWHVLDFTISGQYAYLYNYDYSTHQSWIKVMDVTTENIVRDNFITDNTKIETPYNITVNPLNGDVYITDADNFTVNGDVYCFSKDGKKKFSFSTGLNPGAIVFKY